MLFNITRIGRAFKGINRKELAAAMGTSITVINQIAAGIKTVSAKRAVDIEELTSGKVKANVLRPDIFRLTSCPNRPLPGTRREKK
jgi:DNA-binding transcriptional regulator YdaS (Cro superfamily)